MPDIVVGVHWRVAPNTKDYPELWEQTIGMAKEALQQQAEGENAKPFGDITTEVKFTRLVYPDGITAQTADPDNPDHWPEEVGCMSAAADTIHLMMETQAHARS